MFQSVYECDIIIFLLHNDKISFMETDLNQLRYFSLLFQKIRGMIVENLKESFDKHTKPDHMVAEGLKRVTGNIDELSPATLVCTLSIQVIIDMQTPRLRTRFPK